MLSLSGYRLMLRTEGTDMRLGFNGLSGIVFNEMKENPFAGETIYAFFNGRVVGKQQCTTFRQATMHYFGNQSAPFRQRQCTTSAIRMHQGEAKRIYDLLLTISFAGP